ncbi:MAG: hypothetical protein KAH18_08035 [Psychromonas sp.]|nr:hypothetical protein [Psychromonas sp.]
MEILGWFQSKLGSKMFTRIRDYLSIYHKDRVTSSEAMTLLFKDEFPKNMQKISAQFLEHTELLHFI